MTARSQTCNVIAWHHKGKLRDVNDIADKKKLHQLILIPFSFHLFIIQTHFFPWFMGWTIFRQRLKILKIFHSNLNNLKTFCLCGVNDFPKSDLHSDCSLHAVSLSLSLSLSRHSFKRCGGLRQVLSNVNHLAFLRKNQSMWGKVAIMELQKIWLP